MKYTYTNSFSLYKAAMRAYIRSSGRRRFWFHFQMWGMLTLGLILAAIALLNGTRVSTILLPLCAGLVAGGIVGPALRPWNLRRCYKAWSGESKGKLVYVAIEDGELRSGTEGKSEGRFQRNAICDIAEDKAVLLLFLNKRKFLYFPKALLPAEALSEIRAWLQLPGAPTSC
jgi:hypothetical protein